MSEEQNKTKKTVVRSVAYPGVALGEAVEFTTRLRTSMGKGPYSREQVAKALGHPNISGPAARKVAALVHFGLLERAGNAYSQGALAQEIVVPLSEEQKQAAVRRAAFMPKLFSTLYARYAGQALPNMLANIIVRDGVSEGAAKEVVKIFTESMIFAGLLENGILKSDASTVETASAHDQPDPTATAPKVPAVRVAAGSSDQFEFEFAGGIRLLVPRNKVTSEAIADGELKEARQALAGFASRFMREADDEVPTDL